ncbi:hypothetical protein GO495_02955 [Chitinophaga oryziterrae]|uniref:Uncharacterized protein n=1 Tax=Chitinophaga oryziterrae TaxID=1031224 RepID=A0A6N8J3M7_9BACT|nr:hypothetical protein [Chitinophaga oryziterrae]MVT39534.1 hypothetical protein [Chitinophaga oryziterrae]
MSKDKKLITVLSGISIIATMMAVAGFLGRGRATAPVVVRMSQDTLSPDLVKKNEKLWDNYPDLVIGSRRVTLDNGTLAEIGVDDSIILHKRDILFFRCHFGANMQDTVLAKQLLDEIIHSNRKITVLLDKFSADFLKQIKLIDAYLPVSIVLLRDLPVNIERVKISFFFKIDETEKLEDLFFPKVAMEEVTHKYLLNAN